MIRFKNVTLGYGRKVVLEKLEFELHRGDYLGLVGPNGAGKTTLLRALMGILPPLRGEIQHQEGRKPRLGYVPQRLGVDELFPLRAGDLVMMGRFPHLAPWKRPGADDKARVKACLERVGLGHAADESFRDLSGGQKQRVLMARALATEPDVLFLDEPTNGMDLSSEEDTMDLVADLHGEGLTVVLVTHLLSLVARHAKRVGILHGDLILGEADEILNGPRLSEIYQRPVEVREVAGHRVVVAGESLVAAK